MYVESRLGKETRTTLFDCGSIPTVFVNNLQLFRIDVSALDVLVISNNQQQQWAGLAAFLQRYAGRLKPKLLLYGRGGQLLDVLTSEATHVHGKCGPIDSKLLEMAEVTYSQGPSIVADHGFTTGPIGYGKVKKLRRTPDARDRSVAQKLPENDRRKLNFADARSLREIAISFHVKGRGLVVLSSSSHHRVVEAVNAAKRWSGIGKVHAVIGGFRPTFHNRVDLSQSIAELRKMEMDYLVPLQCADKGLVEIAKAEMPGKLLCTCTGTQLTFGA
jgi:7,8-dihydropterin-6-yl-methyl-4-(beta-D-ribofuranosyl)aminobenzene 5'-phosphate synthase